MLLRILNLVGALALPKLVDSASCFLPDGSVNATDVPCISNDGTSRCCAPDELCSSNKLCVSKADHNKFSQGSCLDKAYGSTCPNFCKGINDSGKAIVLPCGSPSLGEFCCDNGNGFQCCATQSSVLKIGVGTTFSEPSVKFTSMSTRPESTVATTTSIETTTSQSPAEVQTSTTIASSSAAATSTSVLATSAFSEGPAASSSAAVSSFVESSTVQSQSPIESQPSPSSSTPEIAQTTFAPAEQSSAAAPSSSAVQIQPSVESQIPSSTFAQPLPSTTLIPSPSTEISVSQISSQPSSISIPVSVPSAIPVTQSSEPSSPLASQRVSKVSSPIQLTSSLRSSTFSIVPQSISVSSTSARASSAATSLIAGSVDSNSDDSSSSQRRTSAAVVAGASVASVLVVTSLIIVGFFLYRKRKAKRLSKNFEASLGRTNIVNEKGSIRSGKTGLLGRTRSGGSGSTVGNLNSPTVNSPVTPVLVGPENAWRPQRPPRPDMVKSQASSTFNRLLHDVQSKPF